MKAKLRSSGDQRSSWTDWSERPRSLDQELSAYNYAGNHRGFHLWIHYVYGREVDPNEVRSVAVCVAHDGYWRIDGEKLYQLRLSIDEHHSLPDIDQFKRKIPYAVKTV